MANSMSAPWIHHFFQQILSPPPPVQAPPSNPLLGTAKSTRATTKPSSKIVQIIGTNEAARTVTVSDGAYSVVVVLNPMAFVKIMEKCSKLHEMKFSTIKLDCYYVTISSIGRIDQELGTNTGTRPVTN